MYLVTAEGYPHDDTKPETRNLQASRVNNWEHSACHRRNSLGKPIQRCYEPKAGVC